MKNHYWQGEWIDDLSLLQKIEKLDHDVHRALDQDFDLEVLFSCANQLSQDLIGNGPIFFNLAEYLRQSAKLSIDEAQSALKEIGEAISRESLEQKLNRELGSTQPFLADRLNYGEQIFEAWAPLGLLIHVAAHNSFSVGVMSVIEGLLSGNLNLLKTGVGENLFAQYFFEALCSFDKKNELCQRVIVAQISSKRSDVLKNIFSKAQGIAAWGGEESIEAIQKMTPPGARLIDWGHRISFIYVSRLRLDDPSIIKGIGRECFKFEQQACSSPQVIYIETEDWGQIKAFADKLAQSLGDVSASIVRKLPEDDQAAEISVVTECHRLRSVLNQAEVIEAEDKSWRILLDQRSGLQGSPLFGSVWLKPLPRSQIISTLRPMGRYLQTAGLACDISELYSVSKKLLGAGVDRIRRIGDMTGGYSGEPHDGVYALQRYCRRVSLQIDSCQTTQVKGISSFLELQAMKSPFAADAALPPVTPKQSFQEKSPEKSPEKSLGKPFKKGAERLYFKTGGSTGEPKLSTYSYEQYHLHTRLGAYGLLAAGLDPNRDRAMNLFFSGSLYGGFLSVFSALEVMGAVQFPMAASIDYGTVAQVIVKNKVNVLLGSPSYLLALVEKAGATLSEYGKVEKIFYGGEHFSQAQQDFLKAKLGCQIIRSAAYGSVDIGPLGYQCEFCEGSEHHLHHGLQFLEILKINEDAPVSGDEIGRLIFTSQDSASNKPARYELGDVGQWTQAPGTLCLCGRAAPRFRLLGRIGDTFRAGSIYLNYQKLSQILSLGANYEGEVQIVIDDAGLKERVSLLISKHSHVTARAAHALCLQNYEDLRDVVNDKLLLFECLAVDPEAMFRTHGSGKIVHILDRRALDRRALDQRAYDRRIRK